MSQDEYKACPKEIRIRELKVKGIVYVITFLDPKKYQKKELAKIYKMRWRVEIGINNIKTTMNMDMLSCNTPEMVRKDIGIHFLAYNIIRIQIAEACQKHGGTPINISFKGTVQLLNEFMPYFLNGSDKKSDKMYAYMLWLIVKNKIGNRPGRIEPRLVKQRPKPFKVLSRPRDVERNIIIRRIQRRNKRYERAA